MTTESSEPRIRDAEAMKWQSCEDCRFWRPEVEVSTGMKYGGGTCHRKAPAITTPLWGNVDSGGKALTEAIFPTTMEHDWCGEFEYAELCHDCEWNIQPGHTCHVNKEADERRERFEETRRRKAEAEANGKSAESK